MTSELIDSGDVDTPKKYDDFDIDALLSRSRPLTTRRNTLYEAPEFITRLEPFVEVDCGATVTFKCKIKGFPVPVIKWYKDEDEIQCGDRVTIEESKGQLTLVIIDAIKKDEATYKCKAENQEGVTSTIGYLSVKGEKILSQQANHKRNPDRAVSFPPLLRTIREQYSLEGREEEEYKMLGPSPLHEEIESILRRDHHRWPRKKPSDDNEEEPLSPQQPREESYEVVSNEEYLRLLEDGWDPTDFIPVVNGQVDEDDDDENVFFDQSEVAYYIMTKPRDKQAATKGCELPWFYLTLLIALSTFYASATNCPPH